MHFLFLFMPGMVIIVVWGQSARQPHLIVLGLDSMCVCVPVALQWVEELEWAHVVENPTLINHGLTPTLVHTPYHTLFQPMGRCLIVTKTPKRTHTHRLSLQIAKWTVSVTSDWSCRPKWFGWCFLHTWKWVSQKLCGCHKWRHW